MTTIKKKQFGIRLQRRGVKDPHVLLQLLIEDDDNWFDMGDSFSSHWLDDMIDVLEAAKATLGASKDIEPDPAGFGYQFKS